MIFIWYEWFLWFIEMFNGYKLIIIIINQT